MILGVWRLGDGSVGPDMSAPAVTEEQLVKVYNAGQTLEALSQIPLNANGEPTAFHNAWACLSVAAGRYQAVKQWASNQERQLMGPFETLSDGDALIRINVSEALVNLGEGQLALKLIPALGSAQYQHRDVRIAAVATSLRAWVLWQQNGAAEALAELNLVEEAVNEIGEYRTEYFMMRALALSALGEHDEARSAVVMAEECVQRVSSERNLLVTRGRVLRERGDVTQAEKAFADAARHWYRFQNADGLRDWAQLLKQLNRAGDAAAAMTLARERDPESIWAQSAG